MRTGYEKSWSHEAMVKVEAFVTCCLSLASLSLSLSLSLSRSLSPPAQSSYRQGAGGVWPQPRCAFAECAPRLGAQVSTQVLRILGAAEPPRASEDTPLALG